MGKGKSLYLIITAFIAISACFLISLDIPEPKTGITHADGQDKNYGENTESQDGDQRDNNTNNRNSNSDSDVNNNVQNNVNGEKVAVSNSINNNLNNSNNNQINNNVTNNIDVNVEVNVSNSINNNVNGGESTSDQSNNNEDSSNNNSNEQNNNNSNNDNNSNQNNENNSGNNEGQSDTDEIVWGVDSASLTTEQLLACVRENYGSPEIWGRYLGTKEGVSKGITSDEVELLHSNDISVLVIWNHFTDATGYEKGKTEAREAIQKAEQLGIPQGVALFADVEPSYPVDSAFIRGWFEVISQSPYNPGIYGIFEADRNLYQAFEQAAANNSAIKDHTYIWTSSPSVGITTEANAPQYQPNAPENALIGGWQYGIGAQACNIDTNLFSGNVLDVVW